MIDNRVREILDTYGKEREIALEIFDYPAFDKSIIGISHNDRVVYSYEKMVKEYKKDNKCSEEEAIEWIEVNTIPSLAYRGNTAPIIMYGTIL